MKDSGSDGDYNFAVIPPELSVVTVEKEGADVDMVTAFLHQNVPGNIEVFRVNKDNIPSGDNDSSDDEPLAEKAKRSRQQPDHPKGTG